MRRLVILLALAACGGKDPVAQLEDPNTCKECHPKHVQQWSGSMHAYASVDPVFLAMNKRGQRETNGALGVFCLQCHAPMAVKLGLVDDKSAANFDPSTLPATANGITCYFCHNVDSVKDDHNNGLVLAMDQTMRGGAKNPVDSPAHDSAYDTLMASSKNNSTACGSCHDVVLPGNNVAIERTFAEWKASVFATVDPANLLPLTCSGCHMKSSSEPIADKPGLDVQSRPDGFHDHTMASIDQALIDFPDKDEQNAAIQDILVPSVQIIGLRPPGGGQPGGGLCLDPQNGGRITVRMDTISVGHNFPSGVAHDRRVWLEVVAKDASGNVLFQTGVVPEDKDPEEINDPNLQKLWEDISKSDGTPATFFWDIASFKENALQKPVTTNPNDPKFDHSKTAVFPIPQFFSTVDRIEATIHIRAMSRRMIDSLVASGDLDPNVAAQVQMNLKTLEDKGATAVWTRATKDKDTGCNPNPSPM